MNFKNYLITILFLLGVTAMSAQSFIGYQTDNYNGVHGVLTNPANIADSRVKLEVNLAGVSAFFANDYIGFNLSDAFDDISRTFDESKRTPKENNALALNVDVLGPSVLVTLNEKSAVSVFTRGRFFFNANDINGETIDKEGGFDESEDFFINEGNITGAANLWAELGVSYARVLYNRDQHFVKGGLTLKYLQGIGNAYVKSSNLSLDYDADSRLITTQGEVTYGNTDDLDEAGSAGDFYDFNSGQGFGADIGFVYEWRPEHEKYKGTEANQNPVNNRGVNKYRLKLGLAVTDIGSITNSNGVNQVYDVNRTQSIDNFDGDALEEGIEENFDLISESGSPNSILPTTLHLNADYSVIPKLYLNLNAGLPLTSRSKINAQRTVTQLGLTPRFETQFLSVFSPITYTQGSGVQWGSGLRAGPLYLGSGSILSALLGSETQSLDVFAGLKVPIYQRRLKDRDGDGLKDKHDACPEVYGPIENDGCPWKDTDEDGVLDKEDNCPNEKGPSENKGCPWEDTDSDGIADKDDLCPSVPGTPALQGCPDTDRDGITDAEDRCPEKAGKLELKGCPDTDGDTLVDIDDACPTVPGTIENNGCPEVTEAVQKQLNDYARTILFDTGKASIQSESTATMVDILQILNEYPSAQFTVEGHTDSVGSKTTNQKLSEARANAVRDFLIDKGIVADRLTAIGYGEEKPIASNASKQGRKQNRRVEINLAKQ
ncbi:MAG: DUF5723 family protein [Bacteroidota bacterium]